MLRFAKFVSRGLAKSRSCAELGRVSDSVLISAHDAHDLTPPHSSAGMSTSSATYHDSYYDAASAVFVSPPGTTSSRGPGGETSGALSSDESSTYHTNYAGSQYYVAP